MPTCLLYQAIGLNGYQTVADSLEKGVCQLRMCPLKKPSNVRGADQQRWSGEGLCSDWYMLLPLGLIRQKSSSRLLVSNAVSVSGSEQSNCPMLCRGRITQKVSLA